MKSSIVNLQRTAIVAGIGLAIFVSGAALTAFENMNELSIITAAQAAEGSGSGGGHEGGSGGKQQGKGAANKGSQTKRGGNHEIDRILGEDASEEDSDRPPWAMGNKEANPHSGTSGSKGGSTKKGTDYGDIWVILRDDEGTPILDAVNGNVQPCLDLACTTYVQLTADGELPAEYTSQVIGVEFGRLNVARSPSKVTEHSLVEALSKLDGGTLGVDVTLDPAGRLVVDGSAIDSPLENLALYVALLTAPVKDGVVTLSITTNVEGSGDTTYTFSVPEDVRLDLAASMLAAASDKTGDLTVDEIVNISKFLGVDDELAALVGDYTYDRDTIYGDVSVWVLKQSTDADGNTIYIPTEVDVIDVVTFNTTPAIDGDANGIDRFTQAADDAVQVLEYVHDNAIDQ